MALQSQVNGVGGAMGFIVLTDLITMYNFVAPLKLDFGDGFGCMVTKVAFFEKNAVVDGGGTAGRAGFRLFRSRVSRATWKVLGL